MLLCPICAKPIATEVALRRHVSYCRRSQTRPRTRPRSCTACNVAKVKCTFQTPCRRCEVKGIECVYEGRGRGGVGTGGVDGTLAGKTPGVASIQGEEPEVSGIGSGMDFRAENGSDMILPGTDDMDAQVMNNLLSSQDNNTFSDDLMSLPFDNISGSPFLHDTWSWPHASIQPRIGDTSQAPWSPWTTLTPDTSLPWSPEPALALPRQRIAALKQALQPLPSEIAVFRHNTHQILESVRAYPLMMLRRETFPPFIHPHWFNEGSPALPEALGHCMSVAHMFAWRNEETRPFLWKAVEGEVRRLVKKRREFGLEELLAAVQALMIYMIMRFVDGGKEPKDMNATLVVSYQLMCKQFKHDAFVNLGQAFCEVEDSTTRPSWEEYVFAESRRRTACLFYIVCRCISFDTEQCDAFEVFKMLPLPSPKPPWEAKTRGEWEAEYTTACCCNPGAPMMQRINTMTMLVDVHRRKDEDPGMRATLDYWNSTTDGLSSLLNLAAMLGG